ncbi:Aminopeptidase YpdF (MP-, MA-, MS-, AP-, NP- specific) [Pediococcus damnosus]|uniref:Aminopeptidase YpdF (MP-, MA-, MS-, AP-, NP-specific) n=1 Tax=Pediococcus damnosus TaxID=51663 RepID=A0A0R2H3X9_9LACO|nr:MULTISPECIES: aminopeptidase P family protein [Pediococcus]AMV60267.1 Aminopeptidase YpdF (MP-, MA-, MS-, AP-, NP- specific) [Pediococcus damnosus]AMV62792.1 Aminopeptidase YpdF (MP-, MA-, MS-, AP-, NP- specific) [Pediococcus damnosus]AMV64517.1 Aminopeptidase YpdF (MP-, MA-, MS-, AP-, NP- specific) [Pediococcus damnosus]AMV67322.1 Aminopeptidase YpdF (MP-, MA-, MS-, AP-, NP- specific) [Pediococcus damnosus]AMV69627.1 Aminopeptidase YpdF (MP-, MA-, MS-, AP-, NP- specific) [Pediococcus damno
MYINRIKNLQTKLTSLKIDGLLIENEFNLLYLTGFDGQQGDGRLVVTPSGATLITDARYEEDLNERLENGIQLVITRDYMKVITKLVHTQSIKTLGFEDTIIYSDFAKLEQLPNLKLQATDGVVNHLRAVKGPEEITANTKAIELSDQGFNYLLTQIKPGLTEIQVSNILDNWMKAHGSTGASFETIVASGVRAAMPHGAATTKVINSGEMITIDFGYYVNGYTSDITRTIALGDPDPKLKEIYNIVKVAQQKVMDAVKPGVSGKTLDKIGRDFITSKGYGKEFNHGMGHGIGLDIHEYPESYGAMPAFKVSQNEILTVEPGIYVKDLGGIRIEDDVLVTASGCQRLSQITQDLIIL